MPYEVPADKDTCERARTARGWPSYRAWAKANMKEQKRWTNKGDARSRTLLSLLQSDYQRYIAHNL